MARMAHSSSQTLPHSQKHHCASILYRSQRKLQKQNGNIHYQGTLATGPSNKSKSSLFRSFASLSTFPILFYLSRFPYLHPIFASPSYILTASVKRIHHIFISQNFSYRLRIFPHDFLMPRAVPVIQVWSNCYSANSGHAFRFYAFYVRFDTFTHVFLRF